MAHQASRPADDLPLDPDLEPAEDAWHRSGRHPFPGPDSADRSADRRRRPAPDRGDHRPGGHRPPDRRAGPRSPLRPGVLAAIAAGGALGGGARYLAERAAPAGPGAFPGTTFAINVVGAFALAVLLVFVLDIWPPTRYVRPFAVVGFLGAFTTFSTWMVETAELVSHGRPAVAAGYLVGSVLAGLAAVSLGLVVGRAVLTRRTRRAARGDPGQPGRPGHPHQPGYPGYPGHPGHPAGAEPAAGPPTLTGRG
jgi:CrcB protein